MSRPGTRLDRRIAAAVSPSSFHCPFCRQITPSYLVDSRPTSDARRRRRECLTCHRRYTTYEHAAEVLPDVLKRDGRREPFDLDKVRRSLVRAIPWRGGGVHHRADRARHRGRHG